MASVNHTLNYYQKWLLQNVKNIRDCFKVPLLVYVDGPELVSGQS